MTAAVPSGPPRSADNGQRTGLDGRRWARAERRRHQDRADLEGGYDLSVPFVIGRGGRRQAVGGRRAGYQGIRISGFPRRQYSVVMYKVDRFANRPRGLSSGKSKGRRVVGSCCMSGKLQVTERDKVGRPTQGNVLPSDGRDKKEIYVLLLNLDTLVQYVPCIGKAQSTRDQHGWRSPGRCKRQWMAAKDRRLLAAGVGTRSATSHE
ncbi:hypothetical protein F4780DRAFT_36 [Xylariomycetidae sp. FL0641]|nr:hypothetical protein F4780DRAFT_36 [Xylariomycetidae sp. FL0641]